MKFGAKFGVSPEASFSQAYRSMQGASAWKPRRRERHSTTSISGPELSLETSTRLVILKPWDSG